MAVLDDLKEAFSGDRGKILLAGGAVAVGLILWTRRGAGAPEAVPGEDEPGVPGKAGGSHLAGTAPGGVATGGQRPTTNAAWLSQGVDLLISKGIDGADAYNALVKALDGQPLTGAQYSMVSQVISALGTPPEGMPPLSHAAPSVAPVPRMPGRPGGNSPSVPRMGVVGAVAPTQPTGPPTVPRF